MTIQINPLTGSSPFKSIVTPLNSNDLLDAILYRSDSISDTSIGSIISSKKQTKLSKSVALNRTNNQSQTQPLLLSNTNNLSPSSLEAASLNPSQTTTASTKNLATITIASAASPASAAVSKIRVETETITISHKLSRKSSCQGRLEEKTVTLFLPFRKRCND